MLESGRALLKITHLATRESYLVIICPIHMKSWPQVKSGQVGIGSNIAQNHSSSLQKVISGHYLPEFIWRVDQKWNPVTLLEITHLASWKSYLVVICHNSHEKLTKIRSSWIQFEHSSESLLYPIGSHICSHEKLTKSEIGKVIICPYLGLSTLIGPIIYHINPCLALFIYIFQYLAFITICTHI